MAVPLILLFVLVRVWAIEAPEPLAAPLTLVVLTVQEKEVPDTPLGLEMVIPKALPEQIDGLALDTATVGIGLTVTK